MRNNQNTSSVYHKILLILDEAQASEEEGMFSFEIAKRIFGAKPTRKERNKVHKFLGMQKDYGWTIQFGPKVAPQRGRRWKLTYKYKRKIDPPPRSVSKQDALAIEFYRNMGAM